MHPISLKFLDVPVEITLLKYDIEFCALGVPTKCSLIFKLLFSAQDRKKHERGGKEVRCYLTLACFYECNILAFPTNIPLIQQCFSSTANQAQQGVQLQAIR